MNKILKVNKIIVFLSFIFIIFIVGGCELAGSNDNVREEPFCECNVYVNELSVADLYKNRLKCECEYDYDENELIKIKLEFFSYEQEPHYFYGFNNADNKKYLESIGVDVYTSNMNIVSNTINTMDYSERKLIEYNFEIDFNDEEEVGFFYIENRTEKQLSYKNIVQIYFKKQNNKLYIYYTGEYQTLNHTFRNGEMVAYQLERDCYDFKKCEMISRDKLTNIGGFVYETNRYEYPEFYDELKKDYLIYVDELSEEYNHQFIENPYYNDLAFINKCDIPINIDDDLVLTTSKISDVLSLDVKGEGFEVVEQPYYADERVNLVVNFDKNTQYSYIKLIIKLNNGDEKILEVFGYHEDEMLCYCFHQNQKEKQIFYYDQMVDIFIDCYIRAYKSYEDQKPYFSKYSEYSKKFIEVFDKIREKY